MYAAIYGGRSDTMSVDKVTFTMGGDKVQQACQTKHPGIFIETSLKVNIEEKVNPGNRTSLVIDWGIDGLKPSVNGKL